LNYWMLTITPGNYAVTRDQGLRVQGFGQRQRRKTERMSPGDRLMYYVRQDQVFPLAATITSKAFEDRSPLWHGPHPDELFMYRVRIRPDADLSEGGYIEAADIAPRLEYLRRWPPEMWPHAFQGELHLLPRRDFDLLESEMRRLLHRLDGRHGGRRPRGRGQVQAIGHGETQEQVNAPERGETAEPAESRVHWDAPDTPVATDPVAQQEQAPGGAVSAPALSEASEPAPGEAAARVGTPEPVGAPELGETAAPAEGVETTAPGD